MARWKSAHDELSIEEDLEALPVRDSGGMLPDDQIAEVARLFSERERVVRERQQIADALIHPSFRSRRNQFETRGPAVRRLGSRQRG
jgi:hypothetical protein